MELSTPLVFEPLFMERVWGGRRLETLFRKRLPQSTRIGEAWELVDRPEAQSVVHDGPLRGSTLHELWTEHREVIFGKGLPDFERFPLLFKLLDAQERLSVQVHPPSEVAARLGGEPKTEMWYVANAMLDSDIYAGLKPGATRETFEQALREGRVAEQVHRMRVSKGDCLFIPSGRVHAIGAGNVIVEVQQNSDTTYRVFDWNRFGTDGKPRELHINESMASINFDDIEPGMQQPTLIQPGTELLVESEYFRVERWSVDSPRNIEGGQTFAVYTVIEGRVACGGREFSAGCFFLVPPIVAFREIKPVGDPAVVLKTTIPVIGKS